MVFGKPWWFLMIFGAGSGTRTRTGDAHRILSPLRLPISPSRRVRAKRLRPSVGKCKAGIGTNGLSWKVRLEWDEHLAYTPSRLAIGHGASRL